MDQGLLVVLGLVVGFIVNEAHHVMRRREQLEDRAHAEAVERANWRRDAKVAAYERLTIALTYMQGAFRDFVIAHLARGEGAKEALRKTREKYAAAGDELDGSIAATTVVAPPEIVGHVRSFSAGLSGLSVAIEILASGRDNSEWLAEQTAKEFQAQMDEMLAEADRLLAGVRADLLGHSPEELEAEVKQLAALRVAGQGQLTEKLTRLSGLSEALS